MWHEARRSERKVHDIMDAARRRAQRRAAYLARRRGDPQQALQVSGTRCRVHRDDALYQATEDQQGLILWNGKQDILIDRFDGRALLDFIRDSSSRPFRVQEKSEEEEELEEFVNFERYRDLIKHRRRGFSDEAGLQHVVKELEAKAVLPYSFEKPKSSQPPASATKGAYSQVGYSYKEDGNEESEDLNSDDEDEEEDDDKDFSSDDSSDERMESIAKEFGIKRYNWLVYMDKKAKEEEKRQKEIIKGDPSIKKLSRRERRKASQIEREREREAVRSVGRVSYRDPYREQRRSPSYEAYSRGRRSRSRSRSPSYSRHHGRGTHAESSYRSKPRPPKVEYITEFGGSDGTSESKVAGISPPSSPIRIDIPIRSSGSQILEALHSDPASSLSVEQERGAKTLKPLARMSSAASTPSTAATSAPLKRNSDDVGWEYGILVDPNNLNVIQCKLCPMIVKAGIYRLKLHIAGKKGQVRSCPNATPEDREKCKKAIEDSSKAKKARIEQQWEVRDAVTIDIPSDEENNIGLDEIGSSGPRVVGPMDKFTMPMDSSSMGSTKKLQQPKISEHIIKERLHKLKRYIARWLYIQGAKKPYQHELQEKLLHEEVEDTKKLLKVQEQEWVKTGCSIMTDAWTDQKRRSIMNLCVNCSIGTTFIESKEASAESHTGEFIFQYVDSCIEKVGADKVVQVVTDNASNNMAAKQLLYIKRPNIFWSSCATHTLNLMLEGIGKMKKFKTILDQARALTIFIYAHHNTLSLMRKFTKKRDIIRPGVTKFASAFLTLQSLYEKKDQLQMMSQSEEWEKISHVKKSSKGVQATGTLVKPSFWNGVSLCLRVFESLVQVLRMVDGDIKPSMAFLYGQILKAKEDIKVVVTNVDKTGTLYNSIIEIIDRKMKNRLDCPIHLAAYCLNPYYSYNDSFNFEAEEIMDGFIAAVEIFYHGDYDKQNQVLNDDFHFKDQIGHFAKNVAKACCKDYDFSPAKWWANYGTQVPTL